MSYVYRLRRLPNFGIRPEPSLHESGDYTIPEPLDNRRFDSEDAFMSTDFDEGETTTITRHR